MIRIATFNVENFFKRPNVLTRISDAEVGGILADYKAFSEIIKKSTYTVPDKKSLVRLLEKYELEKRADKKDAPFLLREIRGKLFKVTQADKKVEIVAQGRADWDGWLEYKRDEIGSAAIENTARVIGAVKADILAVVEAEDRRALELFNENILNRYGLNYPHNMLIDGNDARGIDVGLFSRFPIVGMRSNIDYADDEGEVFSRDCPEYLIELPGGQKLLLLINHLKSKGYGDQNASNKKRLRQARAIKAIYEARKTDQPAIAVVGDFNDTPQSPYLAPLSGIPELKEVMSHSVYINGPDPKPGTYKTGTAANKIDFILLTPPLWNAVQAVGVERRGIWAPRTFVSFPEVTEYTAASDHGALWVDLNI